MGMALNGNQRNPRFFPSSSFDGKRGKLTDMMAQQQQQQMQQQLLQHQQQQKQNPVNM
jgi:hypothetical protein